MKEQIKIKNLTNQLVEARRKGMSSFGEIAHRLEVCNEIDGVEYINDSKATDLDSAYYSLELMKKPLIWIIGSTEVVNVFKKNSTRSK